MVRVLDQILTLLPWNHNTHHLLVLAQYTVCLALLKRGDTVLTWLPGATRIPAHSRGAETLGWTLGWTLGHSQKISPSPWNHTTHSAHLLLVLAQCTVCLALFQPGPQPSPCSQKRSRDSGVEDLSEPHRDKDRTFHLPCAEAPAPQVVEGEGWGWVANPRACWQESWPSTGPLAIHVPTWGSGGMRWARTPGQVR
jgi:hypothetical protein